MLFRSSARLAALLAFVEAFSAPGPDGQPRALFNACADAGAPPWPRGEVALGARV